MDDFWSFMFSSFPQPHKPPSQSNVIYDCLLLSVLMFHHFSIFHCICSCAHNHLGACVCSRNSIPILCVEIANCGFFGTRFPLLTQTPPPNQLTTILSFIGNIYHLSSLSWSLWAKSFFQKVLPPPCAFLFTF